jgi:hypothetical protein
MAIGYRIDILEQGESGTDACYCGIARNAPSLDCKCPNCSRAMFPIFDIDTKAVDLTLFKNWNSTRIIVFVCPSCFLYMEPYYIFQEDAKAPQIMGGFRDEGEVVNHIDFPYTFRSLRLRELVKGELADSQEQIGQYVSRHIENGIYHQLGGLPFKGVNSHLECCNCGTSMSFAGIVDYDDLTVPLYENNGEPVSLIIGDSDCLNIYICPECSILGLLWVQ